MPSASSVFIPTWDACLPNTETMSGPLTARCYSAGDRTGHAVWWCRGEPILILSSLEGTSEQAWPASPPFQEIVAENIAADRRPALLGVGMAGKSHWSGTIEGDVFTDAVAFDIACRTAVDPALLGSAYLIAEGWQGTRIAENSVVLRHEVGYEVVVDTIGHSGLAWFEKNIAIKPSFDATGHQRGQTYRWRYVIRTRPPA